MGKKHASQYANFGSLHQKGMLGAMYWDYDSDDEKGTLRHAVYQGVMNP